MQPSDLLSWLHANLLASFSTSASIVLTSFVLLAVKRRYFTSLRDIPGPWLASVSSLWQVFQLIKGHTEQEMIRLHRKHGHFVRISENEVSVCHPDAIRLLLQANLAKGSWYSIFSLPDYHYVNQMSELSPQRHIHKSRNIAAGYALSNIIKSEPQVDALLVRLEEQLDRLIASGQPVQFDRWFNYFAFDVVGEVTFSSPFDFLATGTDIRHAIANSRALALYIAIVGHYVWLHNLTLGNPLLSRLGLQPTSHIFDTCLAAIDHRQRQSQEKTPATTPTSTVPPRLDMMERWLTTRQQHPERMAESEIMGACVANVGAGADTTSATLQAFVYHLIRHPQYLAKLRQELDEAQARGELSPIVSYAEATKLPYLQACIRETYRYHPATGTGLPRVVPAGGITIADRHFSEGTVLSINPWVYHRNAEFFGPDCDDFNPERWLDVERVKQMDPFLIHWSAGYNQCPGRNLAHFEISKVAACLIRDFEIEQVNPDAPWRFETHFTAVPYGWPCWLRRRAVGGCGG
ncbi:cytochrome P450 [Aspergillus aculeatinus CBS 121060]|uniref:Cytochrome P450 n=1 Tax=Aspergillus aculeatinus CBS 121060 TaxID=1448322 RepID=A0ACD1HFW7_9EURO|nr:cytochrome P450 [Aspergillus aculeatinus CBS 121060]RAH72484.1 cytochrome P450 [Aspergillus aculeatinus CBS 121060]